MLEQQQVDRVVRPVALYPDMLTLDAFAALAPIAQGRLKAHVKSDDDGRVDYSDLPELGRVRSG